MGFRATQTCVHIAAELVSLPNRLSLALGLLVCLMGIIIISLFSLHHSVSHEGCPVQWAMWGPSRNHHLLKQRSGSGKPRGPPHAKGSPELGELPPHTDS